MNLLNNRFNVEPNEVEDSVSNTKLSKALNKRSNRFNQNQNHVFNVIHTKYSFLSRQWSWVQVQIRSNWLLTYKIMEMTGELKIE